MRHRRTVVFGPLLVAAAANLERAQGATAQQLAPTPACGAHGGAPTPSETEGPYYRSRSPQRISFLEPGVAGPKMVLVGRVLSTDCQPIAGALLDFWHADAGGAYDNSGYRCRGHQFTDRDGGYRLTTVVPGIYPGRTRHIHVRLQARGRPALTTQLYFGREPANRADPLFMQELLMSAAETDDVTFTRFDFVLRPV